MLLHIAMARKFFIFVSLVVVGLAAWVIVRGVTGSPRVKVEVVATPPLKSSWSAEEIAADPEGYMKWADQRVQVQLDDRQSRLGSLAGRIADVEQRQNTFIDKLKSVQNVRARFETAVRRAEDEDRWPIKIGGQSFDQARARSIIDQAVRYVDDHQPLAEAYNQALNRLHIAHSEMYRDIEQLKRLREKLALDLERVRLNQGIEELTKLKQTEQEIAGFAGALGDMANEVTLDTLPPEDKPGQNADLDKLIQ